MNWWALLGVLAAAYGVFAIYVALKKPEKIWGMAKVQGFVKKLGDKGTALWFSVFGLILIALGVWLIVK
ncbi:MAG: hypothetical protein FWG28_03690 [Clostridiales bacterium]|nr:hypothetical protein [Clostridiales bacterium]